MTNHPESKKIFLIVLLLSILVLASYWGVQGNDFINYDDPAYVLENRHVKGGLSGEELVWAFTASYVSNWHPLTWLSLMLDHDLSGMVNARQKEELAEINMTANSFAQALQVPANRITAILSGTRSITADTALRISFFFGTTPEFWLNLQTSYNLKVARESVGKRLEQEVRSCMPTMPRLTHA